MALDVEAAATRSRRSPRSSASASPQLAEGIVSVINAKMAQAIRTLTVEQGIEPRDFALVAFGGAGPMHAAFLAQELEIGEVIVPRLPGRVLAPGACSRRSCAATSAARSSAAPPRPTSASSPGPRATRRPRAARRSRRRASPAGAAASSTRSTCATWPGVHARDPARRADAPREPGFVAEMVAAVRRRARAPLRARQPWRAGRVRRRSAPPRSATSAAPSRSGSRRRRAGAAARTATSSSTGARHRPPCRAATTSAPARSLDGPVDHRGGHRDDRRAARLRSSVDRFGSLVITLERRHA